MSQLVNLRQRIKAVETVKKTTNAMRLIAMSTHSRLRNQKEFLKAYESAFSHLMSYHVPTNNAITQSSKTLYIIVGSQKGLCGTFNSAIFKYFLNQPLSHPHELIVIGKQLHTLFTSLKTPISQFYALFSINNYHNVAQEITDKIIAHNYSHVSIIAHETKTFFIQKPHVFPLWPLQKQQVQSSSPAPFQLEESAQELHNNLLYTYLLTRLDIILFESLLAEQAARFISMDNATHNAESLLNSMKLDYNKLRQALITRELADLSGGLL